MTNDPVVVALLPYVFCGVIYFVVTFYSEWKTAKYWKEQKRILMLRAAEGVQKFWERRGK